MTSAFSSRGFTWFFVAATISNVGAFMQAVAVPVLLLHLTGQSTWVGLGIVATFLPALALTPISGVLSDRYDRRVLLLITQAIQMTGSLAMWLLYLADALTPWRIFAIALFIGLGSGLQSATWQAFVPSLAPPAAMLHAVRMNSIQFTLARTAGPALAGLVVTKLGVGWAIALNAFTYLLPIAVLAVLRTPPNPMVARDQRPLRAMIDGASYVWRHPGMRLMTLVAAFHAATGQSLQFVSAAVAQRAYHVAATRNSVLLTSLGVGSLLGGMSLGRVARRLRGAAPIVMSTMVIATAAATIIASTTSFAVGAAGYFIGGIAHAWNAITVNSYLQKHSTDEVRGRVMAVYVTWLFVGLCAGSMLIGRLGDLMAMRTVLLGNAALVALAAVAFAVSGVHRQALPQPAPSHNSHLGDVA